jgi:ribonuclease E
MSREMLINTLEGHECRIAIVDDGRLQELYVERSSNASHVGNIYKGRITNVEAGIQAAFVDFGLGKNGFLHMSDVHPQYFPKAKASATESVGKKRSFRHRPPIQDCLKRGQEVIVQMIKEGIGTKGPTLTSYISIPGRMLVMMPAMTKLGVSRKIEDDDSRAKARDLLNELDLPSDMGFIVRTAAIGRPKRELDRDLKYLKRLWENVQKVNKKVEAPAELYQESDLVTRTLRDIYNSDIKRIVCDHVGDAKAVKEFLRMAMPRGKHTVDVYTGKTGLFHDYGLEHEIERMYARRVALPSGGSLVIDQAEALVAIDINSGKMRSHKDAETTALKTDIEAAEEIARQLRIRDLGGVIVIDFIDLRDEKHIRQVEQTLRDAIKDDRAKTKVGRMSQFGIVEMTRQRMRPSLKESITRTCSHCDGAGVVKSEESQTIQIIRLLQRICANEDVATIEVTVNPEAAHHLGNIHRKQLVDLETATGREIVVRSQPDLAGDDMTIVCTNQRGSQVSWDTPEAPPAKKKKPAAKVKVDAVPLDEAADAKPTEEPAADAEGEEVKKPKRKRRRSSKKAKAEEAGAEAPAEESAEPEAASEEATPETEGDDEAPAAKKKSRKRGRRGGKRAKRKKDGDGDEATEDAAPEAPAEAVAEPPAEQAADEEADAPAAKKSRKRGRRGGRRTKAKKADGDETAEASAEPVVEAAPEAPVEIERTNSAAEELHSDWPIRDWLDGDDDGAPTMS